MNKKSVGSKDAADKLVKNIRRRTSRNYSAEEKIRIVLDGLRGEDSIAELRRREGLAESMYNKWSKEFMEAVKKSLSGDIVRVASTDEVKGMLKDIVSDTNVILEKNRALEHELGKQAQVMMSLQRDLDRVRQEAMTDGLTNVANRKAFDQQLERLIVRTEEEGSTFSLILMDIDHFKTFNDNYGHQIGDQVLRLVAKTLVDGVKGRDFVARYGGEEFAILLPTTNQHAAQRVADALSD